jgi:hypothetical protein
MSLETGSARRGRRRVAGAALGALLLIGGGITAALALSRTPDPDPNGLCEIADNDTYVARVDRILADYDRVVDAIVADDDTEPDTRLSAVAAANDAAEYGFTSLFQMQACSIDEVDLSGVVSDRGIFARGLREVIYDPGFRGDRWTAPIDIEVAWYAELGVEGLIGGWSTIARLDHEDLGVIQQLLSRGLAHTTNPDRDAVLEAGVYPDFVADKDRYLGYHYVDAFADLGGQSFELARYESLRWAVTSRWTYLFDEPGDWKVADVGPRVYGWSVLAPLLRFGDFHEQFLTPVATAIIEFDQERNGDWVIEGEEPGSFDAFDDDPTGSMDAVLEALGRNPAAAEAVFEATGDQRVQDLLTDT